MVGRKAAELSTGLPAPLLARLDNPLHQAEASVHSGRPSHLGLRLLFPRAEGWRDCVAELSLPSSCVDLDERLRGVFELVPDVWLRLHFDGTHLSACSLNYVVMPHLWYPVTTLRLAMRRSGLSPQFDVEPLLQAALREKDSQWGFTLSWQGGTLAGGRVFGRLPRPMLGEVLESLRAGNYLSDSSARLHAEWDARLEADEHVYLSLDPQRAGRVAIDYERVPTHRLPADLWQPAIVPLQPFTSLSYLKCRIDGAGVAWWTAYVPWWRFKLWWEMRFDNSDQPSSGDAMAPTSL